MVIPGKKEKNRTRPKLNMPRNYVEKKQKTYNDQDVTQAVKEVNEGKAVSTAAKEHGVPYETLRGGKRWSDQLTTRKPEILTKSRAEGLTVKTVESFFNLVKETLDKN
eukprot:gene10566-11687_t